MKFKDYLSLIVALFVEIDSKGILVAQSECRRELCS